MLFYETYFEKGDINWKPLIWSHDKIAMKFGQKKKGRVWFWAQCKEIWTQKVGEFCFGQSVRKLHEN